MKLKYKLFLSLFSMLTLILASVFAIVSSREQRLQQEKIDEAFKSSISGVQELLARHKESIKLNATLVAQDPGWATILPSSEKDGIKQALNSIQRKSSIDLLVIIGPDGQAREGAWIGDDFSLNDINQGLQGYFQRSGELRKNTGFLTLQGKIFQVALVPITVAWQGSFIALGMQVPIAGQLRTTLVADIAISSREGKWSGAVATDSADQLKLTNLSDEVEHIQFSSGPYFARSFKVDPEMPAIRIALLAPTSTLSSEQASMPNLASAALAITLLASFAFSFWISRSISYPLSTISRAVREMSAGGSVATAPSYLTERKDEVGQVATSFNLLAKSHQDELKQKEKALSKLEKYQGQLIELNHRLAKKLYENRVMLSLWKEQEKAEDTKDFLSHILEEVLQGLPFHYGCIIIRPLAQIGPEVILARIERQQAGKDEISVTDILERSDRTLWLSSLSAELKEFLLKMNHESGSHLRLLQEVLTASIEPESPIKKLSIVSLRLAQGNQHMGSLHLIAEVDKFTLSASDEEFLISVAAQVSVALDNRSLQFATRMDPLTRLYNRGYLNDRLREEMMRTSRTHRPFTLMILDIDYFKKVNDAYGHPAGDEVLVGISALLKRSCRASDAICRYGGEEIALILVDTPLAGAKTFAENLRKTIETESFTIPDGKAIHITASMGLAEFPSQAGSMQELIKHADDALYKAKREGRNLWRAFSA